MLIEASYLRKKGQEGLSRETQQVNKGYYQSETRLEVVNPPYLPSERALRLQATVGHEVVRHDRAGEGVARRWPPG